MSRFSYKCVSVKHSANRSTRLSTVGLQILEPFSPFTVMKFICVGFHSPRRMTTEEINQ